MACALRRFAAWVQDVRSEERILRRFVRSLSLSSEHRTLDIGCGYGANMKVLAEMGLQVAGVDLNPAIVRANVGAGLKCITVDEFAQANETYDLMLLSHIIEHLQPDELMTLMDKYLDHLKSGGHLIIATPLLSSSFYDDFDHVRPYQPAGLNIVFGDRAAQVKYYSRNVLELRKIWFRRSPYRLKYCAALYVQGRFRVPQIANVVLALLFRMSFGLIGHTSGWMGLYRKCERSLAFHG